MPLMPPAPGWLGRLIDERDYFNRKLRAQRRLLDLGVPYHEIASLSDRSVSRLARKWRRILRARRS